MLLSGPVFSSIQHKGYRYQPKCHTTTTIALTILVYAVQSPQSIVVYLKRFPKSGYRIFTRIPQQTLKDKDVKANKETNFKMI